MKILAITLEKCSGSALMIDGKIIFSSSEERYTRKKSDASFPQNSINMCLKYGNIKAQDLDKVLICGTQLSIIAPLLDLYSSMTVKDRLQLMKDYWYPKLVENKKVSLIKILKHKINKNQYPFNTKHANVFEFLKKDYNFENESEGFLQPYTPKSEEEKANDFYKNVIAEFLNIQKSKIEQIDHHTCHAYYALYGSPIRDDNTLVVTADAWGDNLSGTVSIFDKKNKKIVRKKIYSHTEFQLARLYKFTTLYLRMLGNEHEYKVMGLAPYYNGREREEVEKIFEKTMSVDNIQIKFNKEINNIFYFLEKNLHSYRFDHIAAGLQKFTEKIVKQWFENLCKKFKASAVVYSGGLSMNVKANLIISKSKYIKKMFICGSGNDETLPMGACYYWNEKNSLKNFHLKSLYLGDDTKYKKNDLKIFKSHKLTKIRSIDQVLKHILEGKILATCRGRMEMGQRSLGNRSILADPRDYTIVKKINASIKLRDFWMPFAPIILSEFQNKLILNPKKISSPFMTIAYETIKGDKKIPGAIHQSDGTARAQLLSKDENPELWNLIYAFYKKTGVPSLLNTSFNLHGYPIVRSIRDAKYVFEHSELDVLWLDEHLVQKK